MGEGFGSAARRMRAGERLWAIWSTLPFAELSTDLAGGGFPVVVHDMQHAGHDFSSARVGIAAAARGGATAAVRVPVDCHFEISRALDQGAELVIVPMVNTPEDARRAVSFAKFPPVGERSWGPAAAMALHGVSAPTDYLGAANEATTLFAMIETRQAMENLDAILAVPGVDGVFVGPSDLSISLSDGAEFAPMAAHTMQTVAGIGERALAAGKLSGVFCFTMEQVAVAKSAGFRLIVLGHERAMMKQAAADLMAAAEAAG